VGVDPHDREVVAVAARQFRERRDTDRAFAAQGDDPGRVVLANDLQRLGELGEDGLLGLDPIGQLQAGVVHGDRYHRDGGSGAAVVILADRLEQTRMAALANRERTQRGPAVVSLGEPAGR
jgi:hypothetical protein